MVIPKINSAHGSDTRNIINRAIDSINTQGKSIQDLVAKGQLTPTQYATLIQSVNGLISKGNVKLDDLDPEVLKVFGEVSPEINLLSIPRDRSVTPNKTTFMTGTKNLFDGVYHRLYISGNPGETAYLSEKYPNARTAIFKIEKGKTYTVKAHGDSDQMRVGQHAAIPETFPPNDLLPIDRVFVSNAVLKEFTFTATINGYGFVTISNSGKEPKLQIEEGSTATDYISGHLLQDEHMPTAFTQKVETAKETADAAIRKSDEAKKIAESYSERTINLFDGIYHSLYVAGNPGQTAFIYNNYPDAKTAIIPIRNGKTYTIKVHERDKKDLFRVGLNQTIPTVFDPLSHLATMHSLLTANSALNELTFVSSLNGFVFVTVSNQNNEPLLQVEEGSAPTEYVPHALIKKEMIEGHINDNEIVQDNTFKVDGITERYNADNLLPKIVNAKFVGTDPGARFIEYFDGKMWGYTYATGDLSYSIDEGQTWTVHTNVTGKISGAIHRLLPTDDGEVLAMTNDKLHKSKGWNSGNVTWTPSKVTKHPKSVFFQFGFDGDGTKFIIVEYGNPIINWSDSRFVWISTDKGETFDVVYDTLAKDGSEINSTTHLHGAAYDRWGDRFYFTQGHGRSGGLYCSTDNGTSWVQAKGHRDGVLASKGIPGHQYEGDTNGPTIVIAHPDGLIMGSDNNNNGVYGLIRKENPEDEVVTQLYKRTDSKNEGVIMFAIRGYYDDKSGTVYISFRSEFNDVAPIIIAGTPSQAEVIYKYPTLPVVGAVDHFGAIAKTSDDRIVAYAQFDGRPYTFRADLVYPASEVQTLVRLELKKLGLI